MKSIWIIQEDCDEEKLALFLRAAFVILVTLFSAAPLVAQKSTDDNTVDSPRSDSISGRVVNVNGQPLANATVSVRAFDARGPGSTTTTDNEGSFRVSGLEPRAYQVWASVPAYTATPRDPNSQQPNYYRVGDTVTLEMVKGGVVTGTVTTSIGDPVVGIQVHAYMIRDGNGQPPRYGTQSRQKFTDDRGVYRIYGLAAGTYVFAAGGTGSLSNSHFSSAYETDMQTYAPSASRNTAREIIVRAGEETANVDIRYRGEPGFTVSGTASDSRSSVEPSWLTVTLTSIGANQENLSTYQSFSGQGFVIYGVPDGDYMVTAQSYFNDEWGVSESRRIRVRGADVSGIELTTRPFGSIAGRVVLEESKAPECKNKRRPVLGETMVTPWHNEKESKNQPLFLWAMGGPSTPKNDGAFTLRNLASGQYRLHTRFFARYWYLRSITFPPLSTSTPRDKTPSSDRLQDAARNWITVKPGDRVSGVILTISEGAASFHGQVRPLDGQKLASSLSVFLVPAETEKAEDALRFFASRASADGSFSFDNLPPGRYWVSARPAGESPLDVQSKLRLPDQAAERAKLLLELKAGKTEVEFKPCQNMTNFSLPFVFP